jgi:hypothetical protein
MSEVNHIDLFATNDLVQFRQFVELSFVVFHVVKYDFAAADTVDNLIIRGLLVEYNWKLSVHIQDLLLINFYYRWGLILFELAHELLPHAWII